MKKIVFLLTTIIISSLSLTAQSAADSLAVKMAKKMKDSLSLSSTQKSQLYAINMDLHRQKAGVRSFYQNPDSVGYRLQMIENRRDSLYKAVLSNEQYLLYQEKKTNLISNN